MKDRHRSPYSIGIQVARLGWAMCQATLFRFSPRPLYRWRVWLLNRFGATVDRDARVHPTVRIQFPWNVTIEANAAIGDAAIVYALGEIHVGRRVTISQYAHLCAGTHDYRTADMPLKRSPITLEDDVWIATGAFIGPHVTAHEGAILGAHGVATRDLDAWTIYAGNPAKAIKARPPLDEMPSPDEKPLEQSGEGT
jgi:putative colanic acid biosynthesis acetyltransferase WcaF